MRIPTERLPTTHWFSMIIAAVLLWTAAFPAPSAAQETRPYRLYLNPERHGIVIWPHSFIYPELETFVTSLGFTPVEEGLAEMRFDEINRNGTFMMPESVQRKHGIEQFIILQILDDRLSIMVGIWEKEFGLTLPQKVYALEEVKENIPKTLDMFRELTGKKPISWPPQ